MSKIVANQLLPLDFRKHPSHCLVHPFRLEKKKDICCNISSLIPACSIHFCIFSTFCSIQKACLGSASHTFLPLMQQICIHLTYNLSFLQQIFSKSLVIAALFQVAISRILAIKAFLLSSSPPVQRKVVQVASMSFTTLEDKTKYLFCESKNVQYYLLFCHSNTSIIY